MREVVIVIKDLYLDPDLAAAPAVGSSSGATAGIGHLVRFGDATALPDGWRAWTARWLGLPQYAHEAPASIAAAVLADVPDGAPAGHAVWLATPVHLMAGLTSLHADRRSILRLAGAELERLAASFANTFRGSGLELHPLEDGELLLCGPALAGAVTTTEPARMLLTPLAAALAAGPGAAALRRLSAEIEMWLHEHPLNDERARRAAAPVTTLWLWGGGAPAVSRSAPQREIADEAFGSDAYVQGLWRLGGGESQPMPVDWAAMIGEARTQRALGVVEVAELLHANASWSLADAALEIDRRWVVPSLAALQRGALDCLRLLANDRLLTLHRAHRWRFWRRVGRARQGLEGSA